MGIRRGIKDGRRLAAAVLRARGVRVPAVLLRRDERFMRDVASRLGRSDVVIDIGAHVGVAATEFAARAKAVHAVEPHPAIFEILAQNVARLSNVTAIHAAVSDRSGTVTLFPGRPKRGRPSDGSTLVAGKTNVRYGERIDVPAIRLSDLVDRIGGEIAMVKMDVEGAEFRILADVIETPAIGRIGKLWVETHEDRVPGLAAERAGVEARIAALGLNDRIDFTWP